ncbi:fimbrial protein [Pseudomonas sp. Ma2-10]
MNKKLMIAALLTGSTFAGMANAADGTLNFTGAVTDAACTITPASANQTVTLGTISSSALPAAGDSAAPTAFDIVLTACPATATSATVKFDGPTDADNSSLLALTTVAGVATGVGIGFYEEDASTPIPVSAESSSKALSTTLDTTFRYIAKYVATGPVVAGTANAVSDFTIIYN